MTKTAIVYARVSSADQAEEEVSIPSQLDSAARRAERDGATILRTFVDEGRSAFIESNRRQFEAAVDYAVTHRVDLFYTWSSSRFARNKFEAGKFKHDLDRAGIRLVYLSMDIDRSTNEGWLLDSFFEIMDEQRSRDTSKDTKRSLIHNAQQGYWVVGIAPFGYQSIPAPDNPKRRKLVPRDDEAGIVQEVFAARAAGLGAKAIASRYNAREVRYRNRLWTKAAVLDLLRNRAMLGQTIFNRVDPFTRRPRPESEWLVIETHPPLIARPLWDEVQAAMDTAAEPHIGKGRTRSGHPFTGMLRCGKCGGALTIETATGRGGRYSYYSCKTAKQGGGCVGARYPADALDDELNACVFERILSPEILRELARELAKVAKQNDDKTLARRRDIDGRVAAIRQRNGRLYDILELHGREAPDLADLTARLRANNVELKRLEEEAVRLQAETEEPIDLSGVDFEALEAKLRQLLTSGVDAHRLRAFYTGFITAITVDGDTATITYDQARVLASANPAVHRLEKWGRRGSMTRTVKLTLLPASRARRIGVSSGASAARRRGC